MKISTSDECYRHFLKVRGLDGDGDPDLLGLFAFSLVERERLDWVDHRAREGMEAPSGGEVQEWFEQKPPTFFDEKLKQAAARFDGYARGYLADDVEAAKRAAVEQALAGLRSDIASTQATITATINRSQDRSGHWWRGIFQGVLGNCIFLGLLIILALFATHNPDVVTAAKDFFR